MLYFKQGRISFETDGGREKVRDVLREKGQEAKGRFETARQGGRLRGGRSRSEMRLPRAAHH